MVMSAPIPLGISIRRECYGRTFPAIRTNFRVIVFWLKNKNLGLKADFCSDGRDMLSHNAHINAGHPEGTCVQAKNTSKATKRLLRLKDMNGSLEQEYAGTKPTFS